MFFIVQFLNAEMDKVAGLISLKDVEDEDTHVMFEVIPKSGINNAGFAPFVIKDTTTGEVISGDKTETSTGGFIEHWGHAITAEWVTKDGFETDILELSIRE